MQRLLVTMGLVSFLGSLSCAPSRPSRAPAGGCKGALALVTTRGVRGVVVPSIASRRALQLRRKDVEDYWVPSEDDVASVEAGLRDAVRERLAAAKKEPPSPGRQRDIAALDHILQHFPEYLRQYAGVTINGSRRVLVNAFPDDTYCWRDEYIVIEDGGPWFWDIQYDVKLREFLHWELVGR
jgi:hypothetical protein